MSYSHIIRLFITLTLIVSVSNVNRNRR